MVRKVVRYSISTNADEKTQKKLGDQKFFYRKKEIAAESRNEGKYLMKNGLGNAVKCTVVTLSDPLKWQSCTN